LGRPRAHDLSLDAIGLSTVDLSGQEAQFTEKEVWAAVKSMSVNKSLWLDGLSWEFFRVCWATIKGDVLADVLAVFIGRDQSLGQLNSAFITLVPKGEGATDLKDFLPISLVHSFFKVMDPRLAIRMA
jgi:hypothetical protein